MSSRPLPPPPPDYSPPPRRKSGRVAKAIALLVVLLLLFFLLLSPLGSQLLGPLMGTPYPQSASFTLTRTVEVTVTNGDINYVCDLPIAADTGTQNILSTDALPDGTRLNKYGGQWIEWAGIGSGTVQMTVSYEAEVETIIWDIDSSNSGNMGQIPGSMGHQMDNEWEIEDQDGNPTGDYRIWPTHPTIESLANSLTLDSATVYDNVRSIYRYVRENIDYHSISGSEPKSCLQTLSDGTGDCDDQSILLISLCRAAGIPSWLAFGTLYDRATQQWGPHGWAIVQIPLSSGGTENVVIDSANGEFLVRKCNRLQEWESDGNGTHLDDYYHVFTYNYSWTSQGNIPRVTLNESYSGSFQESGTVFGRIMLLVPREY